MKKTTIWILSGVAIAVLVAGGARVLSQRKAANSPTATAVSTPVLELAKASVPAGAHPIRVSVRDSEGREAQTVIRLNAKCRFSVRRSRFLPPKC